MKKIVYSLSILVSLFLLMWLFAYIGTILQYGKLPSLSESDQEIIISNTYRNLGHYIFLISSFSWYLLGGVLVFGIVKYGKSFFSQTKLPILSFTLFASLYFNIGNLNYWFFG